MSSIHILTHAGRIENTNVKNQSFKVLQAQQYELYLENGQTIGTHRFTLQCGRTNIEVVCAEIRDQENKNEDGYLIVPEFLIPGRPYPIYVYLYAITIYCLNVTLGQRKAAEMTRERFGLKTFSHTTLGRALKKLEKLIKEYEDVQEEREDANNSPSAEGGKFQSTAQTRGRREIVASYLLKAAAEDITLKQEAIQAGIKPNYTHPPYMGAFIDECHNIVRYTFLKYHCFLL